METIIVENIEYVIQDENISKGDLMLINNPNPSSSMKNVIKKCYSVNLLENKLHYQFFVIADIETGNGWDSGYYPKEMCKKVTIKL